MSPPRRARTALSRLAGSPHGLLGLAAAAALLVVWSRREAGETDGRPSLRQRARAALLWLLASRRRLLGAAAALAVAVPAAIGLGAWSGVYNVAASKGHWLVTEALLRFGMENSVEARAPDASLPRPIDESMARLGAGHFHTGCAFCHGAPGLPPNPTALRLLPPPPDLTDHAPRWKDSELFWIVRHGLKYAGMPGWPSNGRDDEVWAMVAFLRRLPELDARAYEALALGEVRRDEEDGREIAAGRTAGTAAGACARCHGGDAPPPSDLVPTLHGQPRERLATALRDYRAGERDSGVMQTAAATLTDGQIEALAAHFAALPPVPRPAAPDPAAQARGEALARSGVPERGVPGCHACHGPQALPTYPRLAGQPRRFLAAQLAAWREGANDRSAAGRIMAPIARALTPEESDDLAAYYAGLAPEARREAAR